MKVKQETYYVYNSFLEQGRRVRKMKRTELSCQKIIINGPPHPISSKRSSTRMISNKSRDSRSIPKVQSHKQRGSGKKNQENREIQIVAEYYPVEGEKLVFYNKNGNNSASIKQKQKMVNSVSRPNKTLRSSSSQSKITHQKFAKSMSKDKSHSPSQQSIGPSSKRSLSKNNSNINSKLIKSNQNFKHMPSPEISSEYQINASYQNSIKQKKSKAVVHRQSSNIYFTQQFSEIKNKEQNNRFSFTEKNSDGQISMFNSKTELSKKNVGSLQKIEEKRSSSGVESSGKLNSISIDNNMKKSMEKQFVPILNDNSKNSDFSIERGERLRKRKNSFRNLPLSSRQISLRSSRMSMNRVNLNSIEEIVQRIELHRQILALIIEFAQQTAIFYEEEPQRHELLSFLLMKKYFYECSNFVKALKGGKNIFVLTSFQIPSEKLKEFIDRDEVKNLLQLQEEGNINLFKKLQNEYRELKPKYKNSGLLKIETPNDQFTQEIVNMLEEELFQLYDMLLGSNMDETEEEDKQMRIIAIIEIIFLFSQLSGRKVKKIQFYDEIDHFESYYEKQLPKIAETIQYFQNMKVSN